LRCSWRRFRIAIAGRCESEGGGRSGSVHQNFLPFAQQAATLVYDQVAGLQRRVEVHAITIAGEYRDVDALDRALAGDAPHVGAHPIPLDRKTGDYGRLFTLEPHADG